MTSDRNNKTASNKLLPPIKSPHAVGKVLEDPLAVQGPEPALDDDGILGVQGLDGSPPTIRLRARQGKKKGRMKKEEGGGEKRVSFSEESKASNLQVPCPHRHPAGKGHQPSHQVSPHEVLPRHVERARNLSVEANAKKKKNQEESKGGKGAR